jgi:hypothetical protein
MIDPTNADDRIRLSKSVDYWHRQFDVYRQLRRETILNYVGIQADTVVPGISACRKRMGNLIQMAGRARQVVLASNDPRFIIVPNVPYAENIAVRLEEFMNRWSGLIELGRIGREVALDSFCGYGITKVNTGLLPPGVRSLVKQDEGPMAWRISQDDFGFDGSAKTWDRVTYMYNIDVVPLADAQSYRPFLEYNPALTEKLTEWFDENEYTDARIHRETGGDRWATPMTRLVHFYFPHYGLEAVWPCNSLSFGEVAGEPLLVRKWKGHHSGPFTVYQDLDIPDNLIPTSQIESVKHLDLLFNDMLNITANQALEAKVNPVYEFGSQRDIETWRRTADRVPFPVSKLGMVQNVEIPGPSQGQTSFMGYVFQAFKQFAGNVDDILGIGTTAPTAKQSELIREAVNAASGESRRKMDYLMEMTARKLCHLVLNNPTLQLPAYQKLPGTQYKRDVSWLPPDLLPRNPDADDYLFKIVEGSMGARTAGERLKSLNEASQEIIGMAQAAAQGAPVNMEDVVETQAKYRDLPELRNWFAQLLPKYVESKTAAAELRSRPLGKPNGEYTRSNVSEGTDPGAMMESLQNVSSESTQQPQ